MAAGLRVLVAMHPHGHLLSRDDLTMRALEKRGLAKIGQDTGRLAVLWSPTEIGLTVTLSDDGKVRFQ